ncbi:hypothetical protein SAMN05660337_2503 [Maridesulfovibrio ferrireducens]|uniref:Uncharacterized protein n=1 Tax=Maridesulfovibrio ferrireducens TaxID=246191 RepID=A0A1G9IA22_9BACT|nr:hypothetical protein [Maridesulfovibrio ferrireducens]SDL22100.1 hypothetical protein SAMN05660337_2503 [Maridesulfovibrio ferrireducens]
MTTIVPHCELTRKAIKWISEKQIETGKTHRLLLEEAAMRFNLSPNDVEFLNRFYKENSDKSPECD